MARNKNVVVFFIPTMEAGGAEKNVVNIFSGINKEKYEPWLIVCEKKGQFLKEISKDVRIFELKSFNSLVIFLKVVKFFKKEKPDLFVSNLSRFNIINILAKIFSRTDSKIIIVEHTQISLLASTARSFLRRVFARFILISLVRFLYNKADVVIAVSMGVAEDLKKILNKDRTVKVIYNPVAVEKIVDLSKESLSHVWFKEKTPKIVIAVGRLVKAKDYLTLLKAFKLVLDKTPAKLVILGEGSERENLEQTVKELQIFKNVDFLGYQPNPYMYMANASVFVLSSVREGFGNVIVEAMACGTPIVATDCKSGPNEIINNGENGILVPVQDEKALAKAILNIFTNPSLAKSLSLQGKKRAKFFTAKKSVKEYEEVFEQLIVK